MCSKSFKPRACRRVHLSDVPQAVTILGNGEPFVRLTMDVQFTRVTQVSLCIISVFAVLGILLVMEKRDNCSCVASSPHHEVLSLVLSNNQILLLCTRYRAAHSRCVRLCVCAFNSDRRPIFVPDPFQVQQVSTEVRPQTGTDPYHLARFCLRTCSSTHCSVLYLSLHVDRDYAEEACNKEDQYSRIGTNVNQAELDGHC